MTTLRHQRLWTTAMLLLAMLFGIGGLPAYAAACGPAQTGSAAAQPAGDVCQASQKKGCQCCSPGAKRVVERMHCGPASGAGHSVHAASACVCSYEAPASVPPATKIIGNTSDPLPVALLPVAVIHLARAALSGDGPGADDDPPSRDVRFATPSRAPPAP